MPVALRGQPMEMVQLRDLDDLAQLPRNRWGIPEPSLADGRPVGASAAAPSPQSPNAH